MWLKHSKALWRIKNHDKYHSKPHTTDLEEKGGLVGHSLVNAFKVNVVIKVKDRTLIEKESIH